MTPLALGSPETGPRPTCIGKNPNDRSIDRPGRSGGPSDGFQTYMSPIMASVIRIARGFIPNYFLTAAGSDPIVGIEWVGGYSPGNGHDLPKT